MMIWEVLADADRERWIYVPSVSVGPLRFGMTPAEVAAILKTLTARSTPAHAGIGLKAEFRRAAPPPWLRAAVTAYFWKTEGLYCVVADAQSGPQVVMDGIELVGRVPSHVEAQLLGHVKARGIELRYHLDGASEAEELGLMMRVQRAGDVVLTRPVFAVVGERAYTLSDVIPRDELQVH